MPLDYSMLDIQESLQNTMGTLQVVSIFAFLPEKVPGVCFVHLYTPCDVIAAKMTLPNGRAYLQVYCVKF